MPPHHSDIDRDWGGWNRRRITAFCGKWVNTRGEVAEVNRRSPGSARRPARKWNRGATRSASAIPANSLRRQTTRHTVAKWKRRRKDDIKREYRDGLAEYVDLLAQAAMQSSPPSKIFWRHRDTRSADVLACLAMSCPVTCGSRTAAAANDERSTNLDRGVRRWQRSAQADE